MGKKTIFEPNIVRKSAAVAIRTAKTHHLKTLGDILPEN